MHPCFEFGDERRAPFGPDGKAQFGGKPADISFDVEQEIDTFDSLESDRRDRRRVLSPMGIGGDIDQHEELASRMAPAQRHAPVAQAIDYMLKRWPGFIRFLEDGRICLTNNAAERALRGLALGRKAWLFAGSDRGADRAAIMYTLIGSAKLNDVDPQAWLADVLARIADTSQGRLDELLPWNWKRRSSKAIAA